MFPWPFRMPNGSCCIGCMSCCCCCWFCMLFICASWKPETPEPGLPINCCPIRLTMLGWTIGCIIGITDCCRGILGITDLEQKLFLNLEEKINRFGRNFNKNNESILNILASFFQKSIRFIFFVQLVHGSHVWHHGVLAHHVVEPVKKQKRKIMTNLTEIIQWKKYIFSDFDIV